MASYKEQYYYRQLRSADHKRVAILGSGIVALIAGRIIDNSILITKKRDNLHLKNVYVHDTPETRSLFRLFAKFPLKKQEVDIFYYDGNLDKLYKSITGEQREYLIRRKMGDSNFKIKDSSISTTKANDDKLFVLNYDDIEFEKTLFRNINIIEWPFTRVQEYENFVRIHGTEDLYVDYDYVINTIPQNFFQDYHGNIDAYNYKNYVAKPITFVSGDNIEFSVISENDFMVYGLNGCGFERIFCNNKKLIVEYNGDNIPDEEIKSDFVNIKNIRKTVLPYGRIVTQEVKDSKRIINVGRFAQWDHSITLEHSIQKLLSLDL
jgi:hypothetical protein